MIRLPHVPLSEPLKKAVLFAFDDHAFPFRRHLALHLVSPTFPGGKGAGNIVLPHGDRGAPDEGVHFYGTIRRIGDVLHMWYIGRSGEPFAINREPGVGRVCYATSTDGVRWTKPDLGLVEHNGSTANNLVRLGDRPEDTGIDSATVVHDPGDADPGRRFKMVYQARGSGPRPPMRIAFSPDGLRWDPSPKNPVGPYLEWCGSMKRDGLFFVNGQMGSWNEPAPTRVRRLHTLCSEDFETWSSAPALGLDRTPHVSGPRFEGRRHNWEEVHLGAGLWDRGSVVLGFYGMWHGDASGDRHLVSIDLGLALSHDGLHFTEPVPGFPIVSAAEEADYPAGWTSSLQQGQAFANLGDRTCHWYSGWRFPGQVRLATWERDRLGYLELFRARGSGECITCPIQVEGDARVFVNIEMLSEHAAMQIDVLDRGFRPVAGFSGDGAATIRGGGLRVPVLWGERPLLPCPRGPGDPVRLRFRFGGLRPEDIRFYACTVVAV